MTLRILGLSILTAALSLAADVTGSWRGTAEGPQGTLARTFKFQQTGMTLTGETESEMLGKATIKNGKVDGDNVSFAIDVNFNGQAMTFNYTGKVLSANEISLETSFPGGDGPSIKWQLKKGM